MEANAEPRTRTYGNYRRPASAGLGALGTLGTVALFVGLVAVILVMMIAGLVAALLLAAVGGLVLGSLSVRGRHGRTMLQGGTARVGWARTRASGADQYRSGPLGRVPGGSHRLPGLAATSTLSEHEDAWGRPFAMVRLPGPGHYTVVLVAEPDGASLVDEDQVDTWVAHWGGWLAALGDEPGMVACSVTIETAPDAGVRLRREVDGHVDEHAHELARTMLREVVESYPAGSATVRAMVALTFSAAGRGFARRRDAEQMSRDLAARLPHLARGLQATGAGAARPMTAAALMEAIRTAYDPHSVATFDRARTTGIVARPEWADIGPAGCETSWDSYRHDGAVSVTWAMTQAPRGEVTSGVLGRLLRPHPDVDRKRVTLLYRPIDSARAATIVEQDKRNAEFRVNASKRPTSRALVDQKSAQAVASEEARGAGLVNFGMLVTATVTDPERLDAARQAIDHLAPTARIALRPVYGSQDSAFQACLPLGIVLASHLKVPAKVREAL